MNTVKHTSKTTATLIVFILGLVALTKWCDTLPDQVINNIQHILNTKVMLEPFFAVVQSVSFWILLIVSVVYAIMEGCSGFKVFRAFSVPITISIIAIIGTFIPGIGFHWFWTGYFVLLILGIKNAFKKMSSLNKSDDKIIPFAKGLGKRPNIEGNAVDFYVVYVTKILLLVLFIVIILSLIVYCIINRYNFGIL